MKDKHSSEVIYALADYKQLVLAYRTKHAELVRSLTFWKTSAIWLAALMLTAGSVTFAWFAASNKTSCNNIKSIETLNAQVSSVSERLLKAENDLSAAREEIGRKDDFIRLLEKNVSTASKKLLEKMLSDQGEQAASK